MEQDVFVCDPEPHYIERLAGMPALCFRGPG